MGNITIRRFKEEDASAVCDVIKKAVLTQNIKDYSKVAIDHLVESHNEELIKRRAKNFHAYVLTDDEKVIGIGMIGPYWDSLTESSFFTIFIDPEYKGTGLGRKIIETLEKDEYYLRADRVEIPASITAVEFYRHFGYGFKPLGHIVDNEGIYRMEKFPKLSNDNSNRTQYNMRPYIDNEYHDFKEFIYQTKKDAYKKYVEENWGTWNEEDQRNHFERFINTVGKDTWIIQMNGKNIGFYNGLELEDGSYELGNLCIIPEYRGKGIGTQVLKDMMELHKNQDLHLQYFKQNPAGSLYERLGFQHNGETEYHYLMFKPKETVLKK